MKKEKAKKKGWLAAIRESMTKTGGCCGPGETCGGSTKENSKGAVEEKEEGKFDRSAKKKK